MHPRRVGFVGFDGITALDLVGPMEAFGAASADTEHGRRRGYAVLILGLTRQPFRSESGITFRPDTTLDSAPALDTIIVPGGSGLRRQDTARCLAAWLKRRALHTRRIASVCTGIYGLAPSGLLDGRRVTTHWRFAQDVAARFPTLHVEADALFLKDGPFYTSAGITAGIDLALALIEENYGARAALSVARELVVYLKRPGGQAQYSEPLQFQVQGADRFADLIAWMTGHLRQDLSVDALADRAALSPRHFSRRFRSTYHTTPAACVETLRLQEACRRLSLGDHRIASLAESVGFRSADSFRRAFERRFKVTPSGYRQRFRADSIRKRSSTGGRTS